MSEERDMINEVPGSSPEFRTELAEQLAELAPEAIADGKIDVEKLKELLEGDASDTSERFGLFWPGKKRAMRAAQTPTTATLRPDKENSKDWDTTKNVFIEGDNLEVLKILQKHYHGKIKMIYIDPPYNTGKDFVYPDNYKEGLETYLEWSKQVNEDGKKLSSNSESEGRYHSNWLNMMYPRLKLARNLLTDDGVIFISIDENEYANLNKLVHEIFGESNLISTLIWKNKKGGGNDSKHIAVEHEYLLMVARKSSVVPKLFVQHDETYLTRYKEQDSFGRYYWDTFKRKSGKQYYPIEAPDGTILEFDENGNRLSWLRSEPRFKSDLAAGETRIIQVDDKWSVQFKQREPAGKKPRSILMDEGTTSSGSSEILGLFGKEVFENPKPSTLIKFLASIVTAQNDIILDFFAGSGTTAHAVMDLNAEDGGNRKHIQIQLPEPTPEESVAYEVGFETIAKVSQERIRLAAANIEESHLEKLLTRSRPLDTGFRTYTLADTNFTKWRTDSDIDATQLEQHLLDLRESADDNATPDDLLTEILIKQGHSLVEQIRDREIDGLSYKAVVRVDDEDSEEDTLVLAYLDEHAKPTLAQLREALEVKPAQFIMLEDAFQGDDQLKTNLAQICKTNGIELWTA
ncbi:site-specific DNA-methyltransferase [Corynebacterium hiratae]|uniref:Site-specific DNA-methyltransferase n=1 Tax=Corynebacterium hiratae TaxID=3139423 RepID=A0A553G1M9_9CORY|nr:site-specific DNA-methyltransferase [Corynebacterium aurimucosum]TRX63401.1 site-specific DNA-methyltransferase [Corynebacterium aurimucosum]